MINLDLTGAAIVAEFLSRSRQPRPARKIFSRNGLLSYRVEIFLDIVVNAFFIGLEISFIDLLLLVPIVDINTFDLVLADVNFSQHTFFEIAFEPDREDERIIDLAELNEILSFIHFFFDLRDDELAENMVLAISDQLSAISNGFFADY